MLRLGPAVLLLGRHLGCVSVHVCMLVLCSWLGPPASCASPRSTEGSHFPGEAELPFRKSVWGLYPNGKFGFQRRDSQLGRSEGAKPFPRLHLNPFTVHLWLLGRDPY